MDEITQYRLIAQINMAFTPGAPIDHADLFAGRKKQREKAIGTIFKKGQHAILFGERGVGKTSLANTLFDFLVLIGEYKYQRARVNCGEDMTFFDIWRSVFKQLTFNSEDLTSTLESQLPDDPHSEDIKDIFQMLNDPSIIIIDELDRLGDSHIQTQLADTIKTLSDNAIPTTLIMVGVGDSIDQLISEHESIQRALIQIPMQRMSQSELVEIVEKGTAKCDGLVIDRDVEERIADYSQGLPYYTHLLSREASLHAVVEADRTNVIVADLEAAIKEAVYSQLETMLTLYNKAVTVPRGTNFKQVLLACALANKNEQRMFFAKDVMAPLTSITGKLSKVPAFARHLKVFCEDSHGPVLDKRGPARKVQYRFIEPLMEPYVILRGLADGLITEAQLTRPSQNPSGSAQLSLLPPAAAPSIEL